MTTTVGRRPARVAGGALIAFLATGYLASTGTLPGEVGLVEFLNALPELIVDALALVMQVGSRPMILVVAGVVVVVAPGDWRRAGLAVVMAGLLSWAVSDVAKDVVDRPRPAAYTKEISVDDDAVGSGWPSTHTSIAAGTLVAAALVCRRRPTAALVVALVVGVARMAVGVHLPLDVLGGLALGVAAAVMVVWAVDR